MIHPSSSRTMRSYARPSTASRVRTAAVASCACEPAASSTRTPPPPPPPPFPPFPPPAPRRISSHVSTSRFSARAAASSCAKASRSRGASRCAGSCPSSSSPRSTPHSASTSSAAIPSALSPARIDAADVSDAAVVREASACWMVRSCRHGTPPSCAVVAVCASACSTWKEHSVGAAAASSATSRRENASRSICAQTTLAIRSSCASSNHSRVACVTRVALLHAGVAVCVSASSTGRLSSSARRNGSSGPRPPRPRSSPARWSRWSSASLLASLLPAPLSPSTQTHVSSPASARRTAASATAKMCGSAGCPASSTGAAAWRATCVREWSGPSARCGLRLSSTPSPSHV